MGSILVLRLTVRSHEAKKQHARMSSGLRDHYSELSTFKQFICTEKIQSDLLIATMPTSIKTNAKT